MRINPSSDKYIDQPASEPPISVTQNITRKLAILIALASVFVFFFKLLFF
jgi:hypothetical protein